MNRTLLFNLAAIAFVAVASADTSPAAESLPAVHTSEAALLADARDGRLQQLDLVEAGLIASGVTDANERARWLKVRDARYAALDLPSIFKLPATQRPAAILACLHREILTGEFRPLSTRLHEALGTGDFNCVTATLLFHDLCERCDVPVEIIAQSGHVASRLLEGSQEEIETTRRDWFTRRPTSRPSADVILAQHSKRVISPTELLGRIYYNRALAALEQQRFAHAIDLLHLSLALDAQDRDAEENVLAGLNNWALVLCEAQDYAGAVERINQGLERNERYSPLRNNDLHIHQKWVAHLCDQQQFAEAIRVLEAGRRRRPDASLFTAGQRPVFEAWLKHSLASGDTSTATAILRQSQVNLGKQAKFSVEARPTIRAAKPAIE